MQKVIDGGFHTTCMGEECAITHARCPSMTKTLMAVMRLDPPLDLKAIDGKKRSAWSFSWLVRRVVQVFT